MGPNVTQGALLRLTQQIACEPPDSLHRAGLRGMRRPLEDRKQNARSGKPQEKTLIHLFPSFRNRPMRPEGIQITFSKINEFPRTPLCKSGCGGCYLNFRWSSPLWIQRGQTVVFLKRVGSSPCLEESVSRKVDEDSPRLSEAGTFSFPA